MLTLGRELRRRIIALRSEAAEAGDLVQVVICDKALEGSAVALEICQTVFDETAAQEET